MLAHSVECKSEIEYESRARPSWVTDWPARNGDAVQTIEQAEGTNEWPNKLHRLASDEWHRAFVAASVLLCASNLSRVVSANRSFCARTLAFTSGFMKQRVYLCCTRCKVCFSLLRTNR